MATVLDQGRRSAFSLMASGAATITLDSALKPRKIQSTAAALRGDKKAIERDMRNALRSDRKR